MDLEEWVDSVQPRIVGLEGLGLRLDYGRDDLAVLERLATGDVSAEFVAGCAAYLGETLLRAAGGGWVAGDGHPAVRADPALDLPEVTPAELFEEEGLAAETFDAWASAVAARTRTEPGWRPVKEPTPGLDPHPAPASPEVDAWLAGREADFPRWVARWAPDGTWDFSPASLNRLADLLIQLLGDKAAVLDPANRDLVEGAAWYTGEAYRRAGDGQWSWQDGPRLVNVGRDNRSYVPVEELQAGMSISRYLGTRCRRLARKDQ
ncbi:hypothetical protein Acy02nite_56850 [Actinoplanes cyaneus]|uniref:Uncharacterized protein n=1 Tax=Actinoplanes cyaneus TaxID=52696 RepID=A0A919M9R3_9ACTN|nr:hypothetical protein [Actinoplanes cyaneus]GID67804.1 hypothetical protein Acy02nite_56850 [Actinoplanes cyaneus]